MSGIVLIKRANPSNSSNALENFDKLSRYAIKGSLLAKKQAMEKGIAFTIMRDHKIYSVSPNGHEEMIHVDPGHEILFKPIRIEKK